MRLPIKLARCGNSMLAENPYQSPLTDCPGSRKVLAYRYYAPDKCPCCQSKMTFLKYLHVGRFEFYKCWTCKAKFRIVVPWLMTIQLVWCSVPLLLLFDVPFAGLKLGLSPIVVFITWISTNFCWLALFERWYFRYLQKHGRLVPWDSNEPLDTPSSKA